ncbi:MAG TPA: Na+/H+ antiporter NhaC family protein [Jiangellales bacterium]|nr:Na+/H+ antiporter NhaC family protein [Jiangellales bacterium]
MPRTTSRVPRRRRQVPESRRAVRRRRGGRVHVLVAALLGCLAVLGLAGAASASGTASGPDYVVELPDQLLAGVPTPVTVTLTEGAAEPAGAALEVDGEEYPLEFEDGEATVDVTAGGSDPTVRLLVGGDPVSFATSPEAAESVTEETTASSLPGWVSLLPPLVAIGVALAFRQVLPALFLGVWVGAWALEGFTITGLWSALLAVPNVWVLEALAPPDGDTSHASIVVFTMLIGGLVGIIARNGGTRGVVDSVTRWTTDRRRGQTVTAGLGLVVFFDDYANTLVVGNSMRPVTDRLKISREKLAYLVDSTSAPVASLALISTWIGFEVGLIQEALDSIGVDESGYSAFVNSLPYRFYPILALVLVFLVALWGRDLAAMHKAETRAVHRGEVSRVDNLAAARDEEMAPKDGVPHRLVNAVIPLVVLVGVALGALFVTGEGSTVREIVGSADSYSALVYASIVAVLVAGVMSVAQQVLTLSETVSAWFAGVRAVLFVLIVLVLAWALSAVTGALNTAGYLADLLGDDVPLWIVPALLFLLAAGTAFATGTSWGTMGILMPLTIPLTWAITQGSGVSDEAATTALYAAISTVLAGAVWGDHCSPISDTTVLSAMASGCDPVDHVNTQLPYAMLAGVASLGALVLIGLGVPWWLTWPPAIAVVVAWLWWRGRRVDEPTEPAAADEAAASAVG